MSFNNAIASMKEQDFDFVLKNGKRSSVLNNIDFESLCYSSYRFVKDIAPDLVKAGQFERLIFECFTDRKIWIFENDVNNWNYNECLAFVFWIIDDLKHWNEMEKQHLSSEPDIDMIASGINELNIFGDLNTIDAFAVKYNKTHDEVRNWSYQMMFDLQLKSIKEAEFQKKYQKRMSDKINQK